MVGSIRMGLEKAAAVCGALLVSCTLFVPDTRTLADRARAIEPRCSGFSSESAAPLLAPTAIDSIEPAYSRVQSGSNDREARLRGARIHVRPLPGVSRESLTRVLECHEVRVALGREPMADDDPYVLPGRWVDIDVDSVGDGFAVNARADDFADAQKILARARRLAPRPSP
jgi:hypothetical protein